MVPFSTLSLKKWYLTSMCLVLEWSTGFFATLMALVLSQRSGIWVHSSPKSLNVYEIHNSWEQQLAAATYSASVVDWAKLDCLREDHETNEDPRNWQEPEVDFLSTRQIAKSASEKPCVDARCTPSAKHTASRTSWLQTCRESWDVPVKFPWKLTKDKVVKYQSLELAGWYQTVPYLRLQSQMGWHIAIESYLPINRNHSGALERKK
jgi:hypothetical protein